MPQKAQKYCSGKFNRCTNKVRVGEKYCPDCEKKYSKMDREKYERDRGSAAQRGYDSHWNNVSAKYLKRNPFCELCGFPVLSRVAHHIVPLKEGGAKSNFDNLMALCFSCHAKIHAEQTTISEAGVLTYK